MIYTVYMTLGGELDFLKARICDVDIEPSEIKNLVDALHCEINYNGWEVR